MPSSKTAQAPLPASAPGPKAADGGSLRVTSEPDRAAAAWRAAANSDSAFTNLTKALPSLLAASGLMPTLAFIHAKAGKKSAAEHTRLDQILLSWIHSREVTGSPAYEPLQEWLLSLKPGQYRLVTEEVLGLVAWLRHFADARSKK